ncbi:hypothetical protein JXQ70_11300 [bacterium]|nr:hypothetical protein [bacterium]
MTNDTSIRSTEMLNPQIAVVLLNNIDLDWSLTEIQLVRSAMEKLKKKLSSAGYTVRILNITDCELKTRLKKFPPEEWIIFNWCEGLPGIPHSDVDVAKTLETLHYTFTGSTADVLALSWDKARVKQILDQANIPTPAWKLSDSSDVDDWNCFPAIVKPAWEHSSIGIDQDAVVLNREALQQRVAFVIDELAQPALIEDFIDGREFHVTMWGHSELTMLPVAEMDFTGFNNIKDRLCTYDSKFLPNSRHYKMIQLVLPAPLSAPQLTRLETLCQKACQAIGIRDYARLDLRLRNGTFYILDINPNADISPDTSPILAADLEGYSHADFCQQLILFAAQRHPKYSTV